MTGNIVHQNMIKRFNQHSMMVLKTCTDVVKPHVNGDAAVAGSGSSSATNGNGGTEATNGNHTNSDEPATKVSRILEKVQYDDLMGADEDGGSVNAVNGTQLNLAKVERYGSMSATFDQVNGKGHENSLMDLNATQAHICGLTDSWAMRTPHKALVSATAAVNALGELSPGGSLMRGFQEQSLARKWDKYK